MHPVLSPAWVSPAQLADSRFHTGGGLGGRRLGPAGPISETFQPEIVISAQPSMHRLPRASPGISARPSHQTEG